MQSILGTAVWKEAPRCCPQLAMPSYRYLPGKNLHPGENHLPTFTDQEALRYGIDLYHGGYFYEAHEAWESLWLHLPKGDLQRALLHGLIQLTAAMLKLELRQWAPAQRLSRRALHYIDSVRHHSPQVQGVDVSQLADQVQRYFQAFWANITAGEGLVVGNAPRIHVR